MNARIIFAVILQKSTYLLSAVITNNDVNNSKLMQSHNNIDYTDKTSIIQMIRNEIEETHYKNVDDENDLQQLITRYEIYEELRAYNSEDLELNIFNLSSTSARTSSYVNDVTNRFTEAKIAHWWYDLAQL